MKTYIKPELITAAALQPVGLLAASNGGLNLFQSEGDYPFDAAPPFHRTPMGG